MKTKKILSICLMILILISLAGCKGIFAPGGKPLFSDPDAKYWGNIAIESYDELIRGFEMKKQNADNYSDFYYSFDDSFDDNYKVIYYFKSPNAWITYPITVDQYFAKGGPGDIASLSTYLFFVTEDECDKKEDFHVTFNEIPESQREVEKYPYVTIENFDGSSKLTNEQILELTPRETYALDGRYKYEMCYEGDRILVFNSCRELSESEIQLLVSHLVIVN